MHGYYRDTEKVTVLGSYGQNLRPGPNKPPVSGVAHMRSHMFKRDQRWDLLLNLDIKSLSPLLQMVRLTGQLGPHPPNTHLLHHGRNRPVKPDQPPSGRRRDSHPPDPATVCRRVKLCGHARDLQQWWRGRARRAAEPTKSHMCEPASCRCMCKKINVFKKRLPKHSVS